MLLFGALEIAAFASAQPYSVVHEFYLEPGYPISRLIEAPDGKLYGTTNQSVYALVPDGVDGYSHALLHRFTNDDGVRPNSLLLASGFLYGTTERGGVNDSGTIFRIDGAGVFSVLHQFAGVDGTWPLGLVEGADGALYGTTYVGGANAVGTIFRIDTGGTLTTVHTFSADTGASPSSPLILASDGDFYGTTTYPPTVFRITGEGDLTTLVTMAAGQSPLGVVEGSDGLFYGTTSALSGGVVFRVSADGDFEFLHTFSSPPGPTSTLIQASDGKFYGASGPTDVFPPLPPAPSGIYRISTEGAYESVHVFSGPEGSGSTALLEASDGKLYGASANGGVIGHGTVFRMATGGVVELVHDFGMTEGAGIIAPLLAASDGNLYGLATYGGEHGHGSVFRLGLPDDFSLLHAFEDGVCSPGTPFVEGDGGDLYGVSFCGGEFSHGEFIRMDAAGNVEVLKSFENYGDGPMALMRASDGNFYGITETDRHVAMLNSSGGLSYPFPFEFPDFAYPGRFLVEGPDGRLYGTMAVNDGNTSALFRIEASGDLTIVVEFPPSVETTINPLTLGSDGWFYGTSYYGGILFSGTVFRVDTSGAFELLYAFRPFPSGDARNPLGGLTEGPDGAFYGAAYGGPTLESSGAIFRVDTAGNTSIAHFFRGGEEGEWPGQLALANDGRLYAPAQRFDVGYEFLFRLDPASVLTGMTVEPGSGSATGGTSVTIGGPDVQPGASVSFGAYPAAAIAAAGSGGTIEVVTPPVAPGVLYHVIVRNPDGAEGSIPNAWFADFLDVPPADIFHASVEKIFRAAITAGCSGGNYCRNSPVTRAQMAVFLLKAKYGYLHAPPPATGLVFDDVPIDAFAAAWIEELAALEIAAGCGGGNYCPDNPVTRAQMAVFLLKTLEGAAYTPPEATGAVFEDVPVDAFAADFIEDLAGRGITGGCSQTPPLYCPGDPNTRGQMAVFLAATFGLP